MKKEVKAMTSLALALTLTLTLDRTAFALDGGLVEPVEPDYSEIVEEIFPGYQDGQISPQWSSGDKDVANPGTHGYITQVAWELLRDDNTAAYKFYSGQRTNLIRGSVLPDADEKNDGLRGIFTEKMGKIGYNAALQLIQNALSITKML